MQINAWLVKWSFKHASDVTTISIGVSFTFSATQYIVRILQKASLVALAPCQPW